MFCCFWIRNFDVDYATRSEKVCPFLIGFDFNVKVPLFVGVNSDTYDVRLGGGIFYDKGNFIIEFFWRRVLLVRF